MTPAIHSSNPVVASIIQGAAPRPARVAAARGILPLPQADLLEVLVAFATSDDGELSEHARETLASMEEDSLRVSIRSGEVAPVVLEHLAAMSGLPSAVQETLVTNAELPPAALVRIARETKSPQILELLAANQRLLIETPAIIDAILRNPACPSEASRKASETRHEFFEKDRGLEQIARELRAQGKEAAAEFVEQGNFESDEDALLLAEHIEVPDSETDDSWLALEYIEELYEESPEQRAAIVEKIVGEFKHEDWDTMPLERIAMINRVLKMGMKDRVKLAMKGDREARNILVRNPNRIVAQAVINNPRITEQEVEKIAAMRTINEDVLRQIAASRQWSRNYTIAHNLARNPRTPVANVMNILTRLQLRDLTALSKNKNVSDNVRRQALRLAQARTGKGG